MRKTYVAAIASFVGLAVVLSGCSSAGSPSSSSKSNDPIVIGSSVSLTGPASFVGQGFQVGATLAMDEINANGGINGRNLEIKFADDEGTPDGGVAASRQLVLQDKVLAVLGGGTSTSTVASIPFFRENGIVNYVSLSSDPRVLEQFNSNIFVGSTISQADGVKVYAKYIQDVLHAKTVATIVCDQGHCISGAPLLEAELKELNISVVQKTSFNSGDTDFTGQIQKIKDSKPDAVFIYGLAADGGRIIPQLRRAGVSVPLVSDTSLADLSVVEVAGASAVGFTAFWLGGPQFLTDNTGEMGKWLASLKKYQPETPNGTPNLYSLMAYSDTYVLAEALRAAGPTLNSSTIIKSLETNIQGFVGGQGPNWEFAAAVGVPRTFTTKDHQGNRFVSAITVKDGKFVAVE